MTASSDTRFLYNSSIQVDFLARKLAPSVDHCIQFGCFSVNMAMVTNHLMAVIISFQGHHSKIKVFRKIKLVPQCSGFFF